MFNKILMSFLSFLLMFQITPPITNNIVMAASKETLRNPFIDIDSSFAKDKIVLGYNYGFINGLTDTQFAPKDKLTIEQFIKLTITGLNESNNLASKSVLGKASKWANDYIATAIHLKWISASDFKDYTQTITREQAAYILGKAFESYGQYYIDEQLPALTFTDQSHINRNYVRYISALQHFEVISGVTDSKFDPKGQLTREQGVTLLMRLLAVQNTLVAYNNYYKIADATEAIDRMKVSYLLHPSRYTLNALGQMYAIANEWDEALMLFEKARDTYGLTRESTAQLAYALYENNRAEEAGTLLRSSLGKMEPNEFEKLLLSKLAIAMQDEEGFNKEMAALTKSNIKAVKDLAEKINEQYADYNWDEPIQQNNQPVDNACPYGVNDLDKSATEVLDYYRDPILNTLSFMTIAAGLIHPTAGFFMNAVSIGASLTYATIDYKAAKEAQVSLVDYGIDFSNNYAEGIMASADGMMIYFTLDHINDVYGASSEYASLFNQLDKTVTIASIGIFVDTIYESDEEYAESIAKKEDYRYLVETSPSFYLGWYIADYIKTLNRHEWYEMEYFNAKGNRELQLEWCRNIVNSLEDSIPDSLKLVIYQLEKLSASRENYQFMVETLNMIRRESSVVPVRQFYRLNQTIYDMEQELNIPKEERIGNKMQFKAATYY